MRTKWRCAILSVLLLLRPAATRGGEAALTAATADEAQQLQARALDIEKRLARILPTPFRAPVTVKVIDREALRPIVEREMATELPPAELDFQQSAWRLLGLAGPDFDLKQAILDLLAANVGGFYLPREKAFYLMPGMPYQDLITAHELTHAHQDQYFDLEALRRARQGNDDAILALTALIEGEAMQSMAIYAVRHGNPWQIVGGAFLSSLLSGSQTASLAAAPPLLRESLLFPYTEGQFLVSLLHAQGGWKRIRQSFTDPPASSEQVLHPVKYMRRRDRPTPLALPHAATVLGAGWEAVGANTLGEFGMRQWFASQGLDYAAATRAATGWDGDRFALYRHAEEGQVLLWVTVWDSEEDCQTFSRAAQETRLLREQGSEGPTFLRSADVAGLAAAGTPALRTRLCQWLVQAQTSGALFAADHRDD